MLGGECVEVTCTAGTGKGRRVQQKQVRLPDDVQAEIVRRFSSGTLQRELAEIYGVHRTTIAAIVRRNEATTRARRTSSPTA